MPSYKNTIVSLPISNLFAIIKDASKNIVFTFWPKVIAKGLLFYKTSDALS
jgi:hypothetical protein